MDYQPITLDIFKYPRRPHLSIAARLIRDKPDYLLTLIPLGSPFYSYKEGRNYRGRRLIMHLFWPGRYYNVELTWLEDATFLGYYVNLALPVEWDGDTLAYVDLELDISWYKGEQIKILDEEDYEALKVKYNLPAELISRVSETTSEALQMMEARAFPFDGSLDTYPWR